MKKKIREKEQEKRKRDYRRKEERKRRQEWNRLKRKFEEENEPLRRKRWQVEREEHKIQKKEENQKILSVYLLHLPFCSNYLPAPILVSLAFIIFPS